MQPFTTLSGLVAPLDMINVDTDMIIPKQFLKTIQRTGLGRNLFHELRFAPDGMVISEFVLNQPKYQNAQVLVAGANFGCGSSREHAPWALLDYGIRCIVAPSFADIFYNNCFKNGILPVALTDADCGNLMTYASTNESPVLIVDLPAQEVRQPSDGIAYAFDIDPFRKRCLLEGLDDIGLTLAHTSAIDSYENRLRLDRPWLIETPISI